MKLRITLILCTAAIIATLLYLKLQPQEHMIAIDVKDPGPSYMTESNARITAQNIYAELRYTDRKKTGLTTQNMSQLKEFKTPYNFPETLEHKKYGLIPEEK